MNDGCRRGFNSGGGGGGGICFVAFYVLSFPPEMDPQIDLIVVA